MVITGGSPGADTLGMLTARVQAALGRTEVAVHRRLAADALVSLYEAAVGFRAISIRKVSASAGEAMNSQAMLMVSAGL